MIQKPYSRGSYNIVRVKNMKQRMNCKKCGKPLDVNSKIAQCENCVECNKKLEKALMDNSVEV